MMNQAMVKLVIMRLTGDHTHRMCLKSISDDFGRCSILFDSDVGELLRRIPPVLKLCANFIQRVPRGG
jgi:hypothetical protein